MILPTTFCGKVTGVCGFALLLTMAVSCGPRHNTLSESEIASGWELLFDGNSLDQWKDFNGGLSDPAVARCRRVHPG